MPYDEDIQILAPGKSVLAQDRRKQAIHWAPGFQCLGTNSYLCGTQTEKDPWTPGVETWLLPAFSHIVSVLREGLPVNR